jgi:hypothetical protein
MATSQKKPVTVAAAGKTFVNFSFDRDPVKPLIDHIPPDSGINPVAMEYEIQLLKVLSVGWAISYFMADHARKDATVETFWQGVRAFSANLSAVASCNVGKAIDYFGALKQRVDIYVGALQQLPETGDPGAMIGNTFARMCGNDLQRYLVLSGKAIFNISIGSVKTYLESVDLQ